MSAKKIRVPSREALDPGLLGPCGFYCGACLACKKDKCSGCIAMSEAGIQKGEVFCDIYVCSKTKKLTKCCDCHEFPCGLYDPGKAGIFSPQFVDWIREDIRRS
jgi:hypothetical protein